MKRAGMQTAMCRKDNPTHVAVARDLAVLLGFRNDLDRNAYLVSYALRLPRILLIVGRRGAAAKPPNAGELRVDVLARNESCSEFVSCDALA